MRNKYTDLATPPAVYKYLLVGENAVVTVRSHPAVLIPAASEASASLAAALILNGALAHTFTLKLIIFIPTGFLWIRLLYAVASWSATFVTITRSRLLVISGFFKRKVNVTPLTQLTDMRLEQSPPARILGYGTFVSRGGGIIASFLPYPEQLYHELSGLLYPTSSGE